MTAQSILADRLLDRQVDFHHDGKVISIRVYHINLQGSDLLVYNAERSSWVFPNTVYFEVTG